MTNITLRDVHSGLSGGATCSGSMVLIGKAYSADSAAALPSGRAFPEGEGIFTAQDLAPILGCEDSMDSFVRLIGLMKEKGGRKKEGLQSFLLLPHY